jgi:hypothetical protein
MATVTDDRGEGLGRSGARMIDSWRGDLEGK